MFMSQKPRAERRSDDLPTVEASLSPPSTSPTSYANTHITPLSSEPGQHTPNFYMQTEQDLQRQGAGQLGGVHNHYVRGKPQVSE